ncbi:phage minor head protein [Limnohabitans sp.]|uniref:phage head morphogenesis protein n=1 Tax=Limnohabitans sp. TaxID=1907725 RepID=UPI00286F2DB0|nr:phage minor head protein [Limnohabitans sp.]
MEQRYAESLQRLTLQLQQETRRAVERLYNGDTAQEFFAEDASIAAAVKKVFSKLAARFDELFSLNAPKMAETMLNGVDKQSTTALHSSLSKLTGGMSLKTSVVSGDMKQVIAASVSNNVDLIKTIASEYLDGVKQAVNRSIVTGNGLADLVPFLDAYDNKTRNYAKNLALDQTRKAYTGLNKGRMKKLGVKQFTWLHSAGGQHPRKEHQALSGQVFDLDDPPVIGVMYGEEVRGLPGHLPNCKCTMKPVIKFGDEE